MKIPEKDSVVAKSPTAFWKKFKIDTAPLLKAVAKGVIHSLSGKLEYVPVDIVDALGALSLSATTEERAYKLIERSLAAASYDLAFDALNFLADGSADVNSKLNSAIDGVFADISVSVNSDFIRAPDKTEIVSAFLPILSQWLIDVGAGPHAAESISSRFPSYFVYALHKEWRSRKVDYEAIFDEVDGPFHGAIERLSEWAEYSSELRRRIDENVFDEPFGLSQIYVPLNAYTVVFEKSGERTSVSNMGAGELKKEVREVVELEGQLMSWLNAANKDDAIRVISGGPGSGKSSFMRIFCAKLAEAGKFKPIYIPLHLIDPTKDVADEVAGYLRDEGIFSSAPIDASSSEKNIILVFDGLDELASQGAAASNVAKNFLDAVDLLLMRRNQRDLRLRAVLSGRELVVQENETSFRKPGEVLTILPYFVAPHERGEYNDPKELLKNDLRDIWWKKYGQLTGANFSALPRSLNKRDLVEITAQPLLSYLVALSFNRGTVDFTKEVSLNTVYGDLLTAVYERGYEKNRPYRPIAQMKRADFCRVLEEIGLAAWQSSDGRSTSVDDILRHCQQSGLGSLLDVFREGAEYGVTRLLAAFFFRRHSRTVDGSAAFVFTHKSFGEYLTALRLRRGVMKICMHLDRRKADPDDGWDIDTALEHWIGLTGPSPLTPYISKFLSNEFALQAAEQREGWLEKTSQLLSHTINRDLPMDKLRTLPYREVVAQARNAKEALLVVTHLLAKAAAKVVWLEVAAPNSFGSFLRAVVPQRIGPTPAMLLMSLGWQDFSEQILDLADFYGSNVANAVFRSTALNLATFDRAYGNAANFRGAHGFRLSAADANFSDADFSDADLDDANFVNANLGNAVFRDAKVTGANFSNADLRNADFSGADISGVNFSGANLSNARFDNIEFEVKPRFSKANLAGASFSGIELSSIRIKPSRLSQVSNINIQDVA
ncbi:pentapeptide repeat-containing protein [Burkholderia sp. 572]|uniref:pentapeptide repeat-containing protein n=1 Tax=Burkholderia sp. 572 TaxID=3156414 RepID=UPI0033943D4C